MSILTVMFITIVEIIKGKCYYQTLIEYSATVDLVLVSCFLIYEVII